jgi:hypothetical protein
MSAKISVVNFALNILGADSITSLEDEAREAQVMKNIYYISRDAVLEEAEWTFATRRFKPAKSATAPEWGWANAFPIPSDIIRVTQVDRYDFTRGMERTQADHAIEGREILTDENEVFCKGLRRIEDEGIYSPLFDEAFAYKLAANACLMLTQSNTVLKTWALIYTEAIAKAKARDGMQGTTRRVRNKTLRNSRA